MHTRSPGRWPFLTNHTVCLGTVCLGNASWCPIAVVEGILRLLLLVYDLDDIGCSVYEEAVRRHLLTAYPEADVVEKHSLLADAFLSMCH